VLLGDAIPSSSPLRTEAHVEVADRVLLHLSTTEQSQGAVAIFPFPALGLRRERPSLIVLLDRIQDPGNAGTLIRSAAASDADAIWFTPGSADPFNPKVIRAAAAAHAVIDFEVGPPDSLLDRGLRLAVAENSPGAVPVDEVDWTPPTVLVLGNEGGGVSTEFAARADFSVVVPISSRVESLNVAVAGSVILFEAARQRRRAGAIPVSR